MNTKSKQNQNSQRDKTRQKQASKTQGRSPNTNQENRQYHEQERIETRMFR
jgi:hypothetical protein